MVARCLTTGKSWGYPKSSIQFAGHYPGLLMAREVHGCKLRPDTALYSCPLPGLTVALRTVAAILFLILTRTEAKNMTCFLLSWKATYHDKLQPLS